MDGVVQPAFGVSVFHVERSLGSRVGDMNTDPILERYASMVEASPHNLMSRRGLEELRERHIPESVAFASLLPRDSRLLDVGSGGGLPGIVIAIVRPDLQVTLLEATEKKATFLRETVAELGLSVRVLHQRAEDARTAQAGCFDVVTARAVARLDRLLGWTMPFLQEGGLLYAIKGERWQEELDAAVEELAVWRAEVVVTPLDLAATAIPGQPLVVVLRRGQAMKMMTAEDQA